MSTTSSSSALVRRSWILLGFLSWLAASSPGLGNNVGRFDRQPRDQDAGKRIDANQLAMFLTNVGSFAYDVNASQPGLEFPSGSGRHVVFAGGIWMGAQVEGQTRVTVAEYSFEFSGGKINPDGTYDSDWESNPHWRVYKISRGDTPGTNPDYAEWPAADGAPLDGQGNPRLFGKQTCWAVFHDADPARHTNRAGQSTPLEVEIQQTTFSRDETPALRNTAFIQWTIINKSGGNLHAAYVSTWLDPDLGGATDDLLGCDPPLNLGYAYNAPGFDLQYLDQSPACGLELLQGPIVPSPGDTAFVSGRLIPASATCRPRRSSSSSVEPTRSPRTQAITTCKGSTPTGPPSSIRPPGNRRPSWSTATRSPERGGLTAAPATGAPC